MIKKSRTEKTVIGDKSIFMKKSIHLRIEQPENSYSGMKGFPFFACASLSCFNWDTETLQILKGHRTTQKKVEDYWILPVGKRKNLFESLHRAMNFPSMVLSYQSIKTPPWRFRVSGRNNETANMASVGGVIQKFNFELRRRGVWRCEYAFSLDDESFTYLSFISAVAEIPRNE